MATLYLNHSNRGILYSMGQNLLELFLFIKLVLFSEFSYKTQVIQAIRKKLLPESNLT